MPTPNRQFDLSVRDMELIEDALRRVKAQQDDEDTARDIHTLLGKLHNQKNFYRPEGLYLGG